MTKIAIIGGTGLTELEGLEIIGRELMNTPYGEPSGMLVHGRLNTKEVLFLQRHGQQHRIPPHKINYRANIYALKMLDVTQLIAINAVGGISAEAAPGQLVIPDQIVDYSYGREHTFYDGSEPFGLDHIDFTQPYSEDLRRLLIKAAIQTELKCVNHGVYAATQGPRLESAAEINRLEKDGCTLVGMTAMPEAALARELGLDYANCSVVVNWAAGRGAQDIHADIEEHIKVGMDKVRRLIVSALGLL